MFYQYRQKNEVLAKSITRLLVSAGLDVVALGLPDRNGPDIGITVRFIQKSP